jgi:hypothetical protein
VWNIPTREGLVSNISHSCEDIPRDRGRRALIGARLHAFGGFSEEAARGSSRVEYVRGVSPSREGISPREWIGEGHVASPGPSEEPRRLLRALVTAVGVSHQK